MHRPSIALYSCTQVIWDTFMAAGADTPVNIADNLIKETKPKALAAEPDAFEVAYDEVLRVCSPPTTVALPN